MGIIRSLRALEILDSRGRPTIFVRCELAEGTSASASVPSGASTGRAEARELRDGDRARYSGLGCLKAVANIEGPIASAVCGKPISTQRDLDDTLIKLDSTTEKSHLGANAILAVSLAFARASAKSQKVPLYRHFAQNIGQQALKLPRLTVNLFSGGKHAGGQVAIQDVLIVPASATIHDGLAVCHAVYQSAVRLILEQYYMRPLVGDEGGLAPPSPTSTAMIEDAAESIRRAGLRPGHDVFLAVDLAATHFFRDGRYHIDNQSLDSQQMIDLVQSWVIDYPIVSIEDGLAEDDWENWPDLRDACSPRAILLGDDLLCTNPALIRRAIETESADALLLKVNQIGTLTEAADALKLAREAEWKVTISARSGETEDNWLADLAVGWAGDQIKVGSITRSERLAKYNRLLEIEKETSLPVEIWPRRSAPAGH